MTGLASRIAHKKGRSSPTRLMSHTRSNRHIRAPLSIFIFGGCRPLGPRASPGLSGGGGSNERHRHRLSPYFNLKHVQFVYLNVYRRAINLTRARVQFVTQVIASQVSPSQHTNSVHCSAAMFEQHLVIYVR